MTEENLHSALITAAEGGDWPKIDDLLRRGADLDFVDQQSRSAILVAVHGGDVELCQKLVEKGARLDGQDADGESLLHLAARHSDPGLIQLLVKSGLDINQPNRQGTTVLIQSILQSQYEATKMILSLGADPLAQTSEQHGLFFSCDIGDLKTTQLILEHEQSQGERLLTELPTLYTLAISQKDSALRDLLTEKLPQDLNRISSPADQLKFFLHRLYRRGQNQEYLARFLQMESGVDYEVPLITWAAGFGQESHLSFLLENSGDPNRVATPTGATPLMWAAVAGYQDLVDLLLSAGADATLSDSQGRTAADLIEQYGFFFSHRMILKRLRTLST